jgi:chemotaxis protein CheZ
MSLQGSNPLSQDSADLDALFERIAGQVASDASASQANEDSCHDRAFKRVGLMMRQLNDALHELGYDKLIEQTVHVIPDTRERLDYIAKLTEQAACRVLNATDVAMPIQDKLKSNATTLGRRWGELYANRLSVKEFKLLAGDTRQFLDHDVPQQATATNTQLLEIMMAQDFQDLTGQVIKKILVIAQDLETRLMEVLVELIPDSRRTAEVNQLLNGPAINAADHAAAVVTQGQVDDLLGSLGF